jgi:hypothetical protein
MKATQLMTALAALNSVSANSWNIISPAIPPLDQGLLNHLAPTHSKYSNWGSGWIPADCKALAIQQNLSPYDIIPFNIEYEDCPGQPWVFCRHKDAPISEITIIDQFGRLPVRMRQYIRHMLFIPGPSFGGSNGDNTLISGQGLITLFIHEIAANLGSHAFPPQYLPFPSSQVWNDALNQDTAVLDAEAQLNPTESYLQAMVVALFDKVVFGGIGSVEPNWQAVYHQYETIQGYIGNVIIPGGTCSPSIRLTNSAAVPMSGSNRFRRNLGPKPEVR